MADYLVYVWKEAAETLKKKAWWALRKRSGESLWQPEVRREGVDESNPAWHRPEKLA